MELVTSLDAEARRLLEAADFIDKCNGYTISRTEAASAEAARVCSQLLTTLSSCRPSFLSLLRRRSKWMDQQYDETDAVQKLLERSAAAASGCANDAALVFSLLASVLPLCEESGLMRLSACVETVHGVFDEAAEAGKAAFRVQTGVDEARCMRTGPGLRGCTAGPSSSANSVSVLCVDEFGEEVKGLATELVNVNIPGCVVGELSVGTGSNVSFEYALVDDDKAMEIVIDVTLAGAPLLGPLTVPVSV